MASSEVDQKFLGRFANATRNALPEVSSDLYAVLGLSVLLAKKLLRARRLRRLDTTRDTKSLRLYHDIIFLAREGLQLIEFPIIPYTENLPPPELGVLVHKLRASFYHIFVLFHNTPSINAVAIPSYSPDTINLKGKGKAPADRSSLRSSPPPTTNGAESARSLGGPPGLTPVSMPRPSAAFLLPARDYRVKAHEAFSHAAHLAEATLSGSHPIRLSVNCEYAAFLYDCLHDGERSRKLASKTIRDVYHAPEGMDDELFTDSVELVEILGRMMRRGLSGTTASQASGSTPGLGNESTPRTTPSSTPKPVKAESGPPMPNLPVRRRVSLTDEIPGPTTFPYYTPVEHVQR